MARTPAVKTVPHYSDPSAPLAPSGPSYADEKPELAGGKIPSVAPRLDRSPSAADMAAEQVRETAFNAAFAWKDKKLEPFTLDRLLIFQSQRVHAGAPSMWLVMEDWHAFYGDALRILWLCSTKPEELELMRSNPSAMQAAVVAWGEKNAPPNDRREASKVALAIYDAAMEGRHAPGPISGVPHGDDLGN